MNAPEEPPTIFFIGQHETGRVTAVDSLPDAQNFGYDFLTTRITTSEFHDAVVSLIQDQNDVLTLNIPSLTPKDTCISPDDSNAALVAIASPWIDLGSHDPIVRRISRQVFNAELAYAAFCGISNVIVHGPLPGSDVVQYARAVYEGLGIGPYLNLQILLPFSGELEQEGDDGTHLSELSNVADDENVNGVDEADEADLFDVWDSWNRIRTICNYSHKLSIALEVPRTLPPMSPQSRWLSEPVRTLLFQRTSFLRNAKGYPVLSKQQQQLLSRFARLRLPPWMILSDVDPATPNGTFGTEPTPAEAMSMSKEKPKDPVPHLRYLRHLQHSQPPRPPMERFGQGYQDYLQSPLQPLTDNLESITYEVFEKDPVKYDWYEKAIYAALQDLKWIEDTRPVHVAIVGAGRGPLVTRALRASKSSGVEIVCWAVEKNPNAHVLLQRRNATDPLWGGRVNVVKSDMRSWKSRTAGDSDTVDIIVSELLGSFADNELSPECLDGVQHNLSPDHGISIPQSYSAHLTPIASPRIYGDLLSRPGTEKWELPWVVMLHQYDYLCVEAESNGSRVPQMQEAWAFHHPINQDILQAQNGNGWVGSDGRNEHNARECKVSFRNSEQGICHGIAGYFETVLYASKTANVELSTNPVTMEQKSKDMISWFPIVFPLKTPIYMPKDSEIVVSMWRQTDDRSVWYEWVVEVLNEKKRPVAMSELHSSKKNACLM